MREVGQAGHTYYNADKVMRLSLIREFDPWRNPLCTCPRKYVVHPYTGCSHFCLYCYATSYIGRRPSSPKEGFINRLRSEAHRIPLFDKIVELSTSSDPYPPIERELQLTRRVLEVLVAYGPRILITTKSDIVLRDADILSRAKSAVMFTITTLDDNIARALEPGAPAPRDRLRAIRELVSRGIPVGVRIDPVIPFITDDEAGLAELVGAVAEAGALHITTSTYKAKPDSLKRLAESFPDIANKLRDLYYGTGNKLYGYFYLPRSLREMKLGPVIREATRLGLTVATCREGLGPDFTRAPSCDGSHLTTKGRG